MTNLNANIETTENTDLEIENEEVFQLLYISAAVHDFTEQELAELLLKARSNNEHMGVSGMLLYHEGSFIQALEGNEQAVTEIYNKISKDKRHTETRVLFRGAVIERDFDGWSMGFYRSSQTSSENLEGFHHFLANGFRSKDKDGGSSARQALRAFREGKWRASVST